MTVVPGWPCRSVDGVPQRHALGAAAVDFEDAVAGRTPAS